jgi:stage II sporulation protein D
MAYAAPVPVAPLVPARPPTALSARAGLRTLAEGSRIRVRVVEAASTVMVRGYDLRLAERVVPGFSQWEVRCQDGRVRAKEAGGSRTFDLPEPAHIRTPAGFLTVQNRRYREDVHLYSQGSFCEAINAVDLEKYLTGLVNGEFNSRWAEEAIGAQVIAARTYALFRMTEMRKQHYDVDATERDQVYDGSVSEDHRATRAVERTRGLVLTTGDGRTPLKAFYHSSCGGRTELPSRVWGGNFPGFKSVACPFCALAPKFNWDTRLKASEVVEAFRRGSRRGGPAPRWPGLWMAILQKGELVGVQADARSEPSAGERVSSLSTTWVYSGRTYDLPVSGARFREWLGATRLRSALFKVTPESAMAGGLAWRVEGRGNGHGVGMCQWGAKVMGDRGFKTASILQHYYPGAVLRKVW